MNGCYGAFRDSRLLGTSVVVDVARSTCSFTKTREHSEQGARVARTAQGVDTHSTYSMPRLRGYIDTVMEQPRRLSMVNSLNTDCIPYI